MLRRVLLVILVCTALLLPLVWLFFTNTLWSYRQEQRGGNVIPILSLDVRQSLLTYQRKCGTDADCESPLGCFIKDSSPFHVCLDSTCETDQQCDKGFSCVPL